VALLQHDIAVNHFDVQEQTNSSGSDNTPTVLAWQQKGSTTTSSAPTYLLPPVQAHHQHFHHYGCQLNLLYPRAANIIMDDDQCSCLFELSDKE
jgi:hypothetical protein